MRIIFDTPAPFAFPTAGGASTKLVKLREELERLGHDVALADKWAPPASDRVDVYHHFSATPLSMSDIRLARQFGIPIVIEPIYWVTLRYMLELPGLSAWRRFRGIAHLALKFAAPNLLRQGRMLSLADAIIANSPSEASLLRRHFRLPPEKLHVAHNAADVAFSEASPERFRDRFGVEEFILCVGNIEPRKNQLRLAEAARHLDIPLVLIGSTLPGNRAYAGRVEEAMGSGSLMVGPVAHDDPLLASAYSAAKVFVLPSFAETPGKAALEAALAGTPVVVTRRGSGPDYFGELAEYVDPSQTESIRAGIVRSLQNFPNRTRELEARVRDRFSWEVAARERVEVYHRVVHSSRSPSSQVNRAAGR